MTAYIALFVSLILIVVDQVIKIWAYQSLSQIGSVLVIPHLLRLTYVENFGAAFGIHPDDPGYAETVKEFLDYYEAHMAEHSHLFEGVPKMIDNIKAQGASWGIITNKHARFVHPLIKFHKLEPAVVVCGDTLKVSKPNPEPILFALKSIDAKASEAIYAGDDKRDIDAANEANVFSVAVKWGYLGSPQPVELWGADLIVHNPSEILEIKLTK